MKRHSHLILLLSLSGLIACNNAPAGVVTAIELNRVSQNLAVGETFQLEVVKMDGAKKNVVYWSSDEDIATVSESGLITAVAPGETKILAYVDSVRAICLLTVTEKPKEKTVDLRKGNFKATFKSPYLGLDKTFSSPVSLYSQVEGGQPAADILLSFGSAEAEQAKTNIQILSTLTSFFKYTEASRQYDALLSEGADLTKEQGHIGIIEDKPYYALTTLSTGEESARIYQHTNISMPTLSGILRVIGLSSFSPSSFIGFDWKRAFEEFATEEGYPSGQKKEDIEKYGPLIGDLIAAFTSGFLIKSVKTETEDRFLITLTDSGLTAMSAFVKKHKQDLKLPLDLDLTKFEFYFIYPKDKSTLTGLETTINFSALTLENSFYSLLSLEEGTQAGPIDYFTNLESAQAKW